MLTAPLGGLLANHLSCRTTVILGGVLSSAGLILSSFSTSLEQLYICMGLLTGTKVCQACAMLAPIDTL